MVYYIFNADICQINIFPLKNEENNQNLFQRHINNLIEKVIILSTAFFNTTYFRRRNNYEKDMNEIPQENNAC